VCVRLPLRPTRRGLRPKPIFRVVPRPHRTLPSSIRNRKASEKVAIPDTNTIVCTFLLDGVSL